ncbi:hypothetical protein E8E14_013805 [Neopestalotiopsis sp. 37M]|nr:hypothetical protein E8E14_013805 [Neopestalotiopsis sp. 37M]
MAPDYPAATGAAAPRNSPLFLLPTKIWRAICDQVDNKTIKSLRTTCRYFSQVASLRLSRVFISPNPRNVETFIAIAHHEVYRHQITEIIWDDATLYEGPTEDDSDEEDYRRDDYYYDMSDDGDSGEDEDGTGSTRENLKWYRGENEFRINWKGDVPKWYKKACNRSIFDLMSALQAMGDDDVEISDHPPEQLLSHMPVQACWTYYQELLQQQREVLASQSHIQAFEDHVGSFPSLRRITITPATYGRLFSPLYETPMIRAFPRGFNFPISRGWPVVDHILPDCPEWEDDGSDWQGFRVVTRVLAENKDHGRVTDLRVDACQLETGLNSLVFEAENDTFRHFVTVLARPNFAHLHLDLMVDPNERQAEVFQSGLLKRALAGAANGKGLQHLSIGTSIVDECDGTYVTLETIFTYTALSRIEHLGLSRFYVTDHDLLMLMAHLPQTLRTVELNLLEFMDDAGNFRDFLNQARDSLDWQERAHKPSLRLSIETHTGDRLRQIWVDKELDSFLYYGGMNPFGQETKFGTPNYLVKGYGRIKDAFMPECEKPYVYYDASDHPMQQI